jgi:arginyl-tRNA synthetase
LNEKEKAVIRLMHEFPGVVKDAGETYNPALIANYVYDLVKEFNQFYHDFSILKEEDPAKRDFRLLLSSSAAGVVRNGMELLGIEMPERM